MDKTLKIMNEIFENLIKMKQGKRNSAKSNRPNFTGEAKKHSRGTICNRLSTFFFLYVNGSVQ